MTVGETVLSSEKKKTQKPSRYPLKLSLQDVTVEIRINLLSKKEEKYIYIYTNIYIRFTIFIFCIDLSIPSFVEFDNFIFNEFSMHGFKILIYKFRIQLSLKNG